MTWLLPQVTQHLGGTDGQVNDDIQRWHDRCWGHTGQENLSLLPGESVASVSRKALGRTCLLNWVWKAEKLFPGGPRRGTEEKAEAVMPEKNMMLEETENQ